MDPLEDQDSNDETNPIGPRGPADNGSDLPLPPSKRAPANFGPYRFMELLGQGAFGQVFKVWSSTTQRYEAMKVLVQEEVLSSEQLDAFLEEMRRMANIRSPNVAQVYHAGVVPNRDRRPFFTMEYLAGGRLDRYCDRTRQPLEDRIRAVANVCEAVHSMHELNVVHCDIKPANIVVHEDAGVMVPKLVDFGLASQRAFRHSPSSVPRGTLPFMAPEQLESHGGDPERRWDIYALGVTLYRLIVGECPIEEFPDPSLPIEVLADHVRRTPVPSLLDKLTSIGSPRTDEIAEARRLNADRLRQRLEDRRLEAIVRKALAKDREQRYASAKEMAANLRQYLRGTRPAVVPATLFDRLRESAVKYRVALVSLVVIGALIVSGVYWQAGRVAARDALITRLIYEGVSSLEPMVGIEALQEALELDPSRSDIRLQLAGAFAAHGDVDRALEFAGTIPTGNAHYKKAQAFVAWIGQFRGEAEATQRDVASEIQIAPTDAFYFALALRPKEAEFAIKYLDKALKAPDVTREERFRIRLARAMRYFQICDYDALAKEADWLVGNNPKSAVALNLRGIAHWRLDETTKALVAFNEARKINSNYAAVYANRAKVYVGQDRFNLALGDVDRAVKLRPSLERPLLGIRIDAWSGSRNDAAAQRVCEQSLTDPATGPDTRFACVRFWERQHQWENMWTEADRVVQSLDIASPCKARTSQAMANRGGAALRLGRYENAISDLDLSESLDPQSWRVIMDRPLVRFNALLALDKYDRAIGDLDRVIELMQGNSARALIHIWIWALQIESGATELAAQELSMARAAAAPDGLPSIVVDHCAGDAGEDEVLSVAGDERSARAEAYYYLGLAAKAHSDGDLARRYFSECRSLGNDSTIEWYLAAVQLSHLSE